MSDEQGLDRVRRAVYRPVGRANALENTVSRIVQTIRIGVVAPGEALPPERSLAELYGVSRDTVREAIRELADTGWLVPRRGRYGGTFVADPPPRPETPASVDPTELDDTLGMRQLLEPGAARAAALRTMTADERDALWQRHTAASDASLDQYRRLDSLFHLAIAEAAGIPSLVPLVADSRARVNTWLDAFPLLPRAIEHSQEQHERIVSAILAGRADEADAAMRDHLAASEALMRGFLS
ncbi:FadR/GntR family transcriptional regulator [Microbacterium sp. cx-59]|uniref:FadR/GntR family transcriptional regulator n=1 Tax=Microbacterium sp. cx-59 TaxID=2891207 RepID=UPI001E3AAB29|nr:FCD domain-containing protein [Microbacterium sp. cx-59]MCC4908420.1 GntR family transcriptional regulator [Microbacterium sp. cx-59]